MRRPGLNFRLGASDNGGVDQVSRPMLVALLATVVLAGTWFMVLRPKSSNDSSGGTPAPAAQAPGVKGLGTAVEKAKGAVATSQASAQRSEAAANDAANGTSPAAKPAATPSAAKPAAGTGAAAATASAKLSKTASVAPADPSKPLLAQLGDGRTVVLLFSSKGADDRAARKAVRRIDHLKGVVTRLADVADVAKYEAITTGVQVLTAPTVLVIGPQRKALSVEGYTDAATLKQMVGDVRRAEAAKQAK